MGRVLPRLLTGDLYIRLREGGSDGGKTGLGRGGEKVHDRVPPLYRGREYLTGHNSPHVHVRSSLVQSSLTSQDGRIGRETGLCNV